MEQVLVIGGAGYIGSHLVHLLKSLNYNPIVLDNLSSGTRDSLPQCDFFEGQAKDGALIEKIHKRFSFTSVIYLAAFIQVNESHNDPLKYYLNNVAECLEFLKILYKLKIKNFLLSSSAAVYGNPASDKITENTIKNPVSPYGRTKWMLEEILMDCCRAYAFKVIALRYFNVAGSFNNIPAYRKKPSSHLIPIALQAALLKKTLPIFGNDYETTDGFGVRDYVHVKDICMGHVNALRLFSNLSESTFQALNLGSGKGYSVLEVIRMIEHITQQKVSFTQEPRRIGDPPALIADTSLAQQLINWSPINSNLKNIIEDAFLFEKKILSLENLVHVS